MGKWIGKGGLIAAGVIAALIGAAGAQPSDEEGLRITTHGAWTVERVGPAGDAACTALIEREDGVAAFISQSSDSPFVLPVFELQTRIDLSASDDDIRLAIGSYQAPMAIEMSFDEESAYVAAVPDEAEAGRVIDAMRGGAEIRLIYQGAPLAILPLAGFDAAWVEVLAACG